METKFSSPTLFVRFPLLILIRSGGLSPAHSLLTTRIPCLIQLSKIKKHVFIMRIGRQRGGAQALIKDHMREADRTGN
jgi:hypothetical protein